MTKEDLIATLWECDQNSEVFRPFVTDDEMEFIADKILSLQPTDKEILKTSIYHCGGNSQESMDERIGIEWGARWCKNFKR